MPSRPQCLPYRKARARQGLSLIHIFTLVIDHGAGVRTIFYGLSDIDIKAGQQVKQGQTLATCGKTTVVEMRIGTVPIDPIAVWRGQCNGLKYY